MSKLREARVRRCYGRRPTKRRTAASFSAAPDGQRGREWAGLHLDDHGGGLLESRGRRRVALQQARCGVERERALRRQLLLGRLRKRGEVRHNLQRRNARQCQRARERVAEARTMMQRTLTDWKIWPLAPTRSA